jgi:isopentenyl diphosphate isomerase/L-lactate dehydrogenase-like FMN-dependent dehydrogenase
MIARRAIVVELPSVDCDILRVQALTNLAYRYKRARNMHQRPAKNSVHNALQEELQPGVRNQA